MRVHQKPPVDVHSKDASAENHPTAAVEGLKGSTVTTKANNRWWDVS